MYDVLNLVNLLSCAHLAICHAPLGSFFFTVFSADRELIKVEPDPSLLRMTEFFIYTFDPVANNFFFPLFFPGSQN